MTIAAVLAFLPMVGEALLSRRHERYLRAAGAIEPAGDVHASMVVAYPGAFLLMALEGLWWDGGVDAWAVVGLVLWIAAKILKYSAIATLGTRWSFRVLVPPGAGRRTGGPYRYLNHPNYVAVVGELLALTCLCPAPVSGPLTTAGFLVLLRRRIDVEERAMGPRGRR